MSVSLLRQLPDGECRDLVSCPQIIDCVQLSRLRVWHHPAAPPVQVQDHPDPVLLQRHPHPRPWLQVKLYPSEWEDSLDALPTGMGR